MARRGASQTETVGHANASATRASCCFLFFFFFVIPRGIPRGIMQSRREDEMPPGFFTPRSFSRSYEA